MTLYSREWFEQRAFSSLKQIEEGVWDYSDSLLIYVSSGVEVYESLQKTDTPYYQLVTKPEHEYLASIAHKVVTQLPERFEYIDLGPGTEHKEQFFFDAIKAQGKTYSYIPVDISEYYLNIAKTHAEAQGIKTSSLQSSFEELPSRLGEATNSRFVSLGLTFSNYLPANILSLLQRIGGPQGYAFINAQLRDRLDMEALRQVYQEDVSHAMDEKLRLLGLDPDRDVTPRIADDGIRAWTTILQTNPALDRLGVKPQDRLLVFQSLRYTKESLEKTLQGVSHQSFDTGSSFIGTVIQTG